MLLQSQILEAYQAQQIQLSSKISYLDREKYSHYMPSKTHIEVITGVRRCGKSTLLLQLMGKYSHQVAFLNFEDVRLHLFTLEDFIKLEAIIDPKIKTYFFDEIQNVPKWELYIRQLHDRGIKIFLTGSNASLLSKELASRLTGRHTQSELFPFSYTEYLQFLKQKNTLENFGKYMVDGGFPEYLKEGRIDILQQLFKDIVLRDIAIRYGIRNIDVLFNLALYLITQTGKEISFNGLKLQFQIGSANTISDFVNWMCDSYLFFLLPKFSWSPKTIRVNPRKIYCIDNGMIVANTLSFSKDSGRLLENLAFLFLHKKGYKLYYFREKHECDFIVFDKNKCIMVIQICQQINIDNQDREVKGLMEAMQFFKLTQGFIITENQKDNLIVDKLKISILKARDWMIAQD